MGLSRKIAKRIVVYKSERHLSFLQSACFARMFMNRSYEADLFLQSQLHTTRNSRFQSEQLEMCVLSIAETRIDVRNSAWFDVSMTFSKRR